MLHTTEVLLLLVPDGAAVANLSQVVALQSSGDIRKIISFGIRSARAPRWEAEQATEKGRTCDENDVSHHQQQSGSQRGTEGTASPLRIFALTPSKKNTFNFEDGGAATTRSW